MRGFWLSLCLFTAGPAWAQDRAPVNIIRIDDRVTARDCVPLRAHQASDDVTYRPGVDVNGRPVAPADLPPAAGASAALPAEIGIDLKRTLGPAAGAALANSDVLVGRVAIDPLTGQARLNGADLAAPQGAIVGYSCR